MDAVLQNLEALLIVQARLNERAAAVVVAAAAVADWPLAISACSQLAATTTDHSGTAQLAATGLASSYAMIAPAVRSSSSAPTGAATSSTGTTSATWIALPALPAAAAGG